MPDKVSYFSRFTMKFLEICAASIATAVGGYLVAHLGGYLPWPTREPAPTPAAIQAVPSASGVVSKTSRAQPSQPPHPVPPASADADDPRPAAAPDASLAGKRPARTNATQAAPSRRPITADTDAPEGKPHEAESVEAQVRAALEKVDAHPPASPDVAPRTVSLPPAPPTAAAEPRPAESPILGTAGAVAVTPPAAEAVVVTPPAAEAVAVAPPAAAAVVTPPATEAAREPVQQAPVQPEPLTPVEIKSRPVAAVEASSSPEPAPPAHEEDRGFLSTLAKIPAMLRPASGAASDPPRPPLPVGQ